MATKKEQLAQEIARTVRAGKAVAMETVDFNDPHRPKTCLEIDFPIVPINIMLRLRGKDLAHLNQSTRFRNGGLVGGPVYFVQC